MEQPRTILVVDDDPGVLEAVETHLAGRAYRVVKASLWTEAIARLEHAGPDAVLLDLHMPTVQGEALLEFIRETHGHLPVVIISQDISPAEMGRLSDLGASGFIRKPFETDDLLVVLEQVLMDLETDSAPAGQPVSQPAAEQAPERVVQIRSGPLSQLPGNVIPGSGIQDLARRPNRAGAPATETRDTGRRRSTRKRKKRRSTKKGGLKRVRNVVLLVVFFFLIGGLLYTLQQGLNMGFLGGISVSKSLSTPQAP